MLAYAAHRRSRRQLSPTTLVAIVAVHGAALTALALAKMDGAKIREVITTVYPVHEDPPPPPPEPLPQPDPPQPRPSDSRVDQPKPTLPLPPTGGEVTFDPGLSTKDTGPIIGPGTDPVPLPRPDPVPLPKPGITAGPVLQTSGEQLRPPYPENKRRLEEEATLRLRLGIDERGRVVSVDPVGAADPEFLASARGHLLRYWRYRPATEDGRAVATSIVVTLRFQLNDAE